MSSRTRTRRFERRKQQASLKRHEHADTSSILSLAVPWQIIVPQRRHEATSYVAASSCASASRGLDLAVLVAGKHSQQVAILDAAIRDVQALMASHPKASIPTLGGWAAEHHHAATNINAVSLDSNHRCAVLADNGPADLRIYKQGAPGQTLQLVQVKPGRAEHVFERLTSKHALAKYKGMQLVVPSGQENFRHGHSSAVQYGRRVTVRSQAASNERVRRMVSSRGAAAEYFRALRPDVRAAAARTGLQGAAAGALVGAALTAGSIAIEHVRQQGGWWAEGAAAVVLEAAMLGALAGGAGGAVTVLTTSGLAGTLSSGMLTTAYCTLKSGDRASAVRNVAGGVACTAGAMAAQALLCPAIAAASGPAAGVLCPLTVFEAAMTARHVADQLVSRCASCRLLTGTGAVQV